MAFLPADLYPEIIRYTSVPALKSCALVNSFFQHCAQTALFSHVRILERTQEKVAFFTSERGSQLVKHIKSLVLGVNILYEKNDPVPTFFRALEGASIHVLRLVGYMDWETIPLETLGYLYTILMPRLDSLTLYYIEDIPLTVILSHCPRLRNIELDKFTTTPNKMADVQKLPTVKNFIISYWASSDLEENTSLATYLRVKGSSIETLALGDYKHYGADMSMDLFPTLKPSLRRLTFDWTILNELIARQPILLSEMPKLESLHFAIDLERTTWTVFLNFVNQHFEQAKFPPSFTDIHIRVFARRGWSLNPINKESTSASDEDVVRLGMRLLGISTRLRLHIILHIADAFSGEDDAIHEPTIEEYDALQKEIKSSLQTWSQAGLLTIGRSNVWQEGLSWW
ncbi:hypothetical protein DL96DRAFT_1821409 [Flagelloscypha sp. PMI_526]|nr:hypothetical protein DL96DRAFT_1821409 [Flagelloscypha sp. PMI_526]